MIEQNSNKGPKNMPIFNSIFDILKSVFFENENAGVLMYYQKMLNRFNPLMHNVPKWSDANAAKFLKCV